MRLEHPARLEGKAAVVVVGGGFAGPSVAKALANAPGVHVVLIDQRNHHLFQPLLYQAATAGLSPADIVVPIRSQFRHAANVEVHLGEATGVDLHREGDPRRRPRDAYDFLSTPWTRAASPSAPTGWPRVFAVGDLASFRLASWQTLPGRAPAAMQGGRHVAVTILGDLAGQPRRAFVYHDKGVMATIGRGRAVGRIGRASLTGRVAWVAWLFVHVARLIGFRNRATVLAQWAWNYLLSGRDARLITERDWQLARRAAHR